MSLLRSNVLQTAIQTMKSFSKSQEQQIIAAIQTAESHTSGEIRVHIQREMPDGLMETAQRTFFKLGMQHTRQRNGILFFLVPSKRQFAILGDSGINAVVPDNFWNDVRDTMQEQFRQGRFTEGLCAGILQAGEKLHAFFPVETDNPNELNDTISFE